MKLKKSSQKNEFTQKSNKKVKLNGHFTQKRTHFFLSTQQRKISKKKSSM